MRIVINCTKGLLVTGASIFEVLVRKFLYALLFISRIYNYNKLTLCIINVDEKVIKYTVYTS